MKCPKCDGIQLRVNEDLTFYIENRAKIIEIMAELHTENIMQEAHEDQSNVKEIVLHGLKGLSESTPEMLRADWLVDFEDNSFKSLYDD